MGLIVHNGAIITEVAQGKKDPLLSYLTVIDDDGTFNYSTKAISFPELITARLQKCTIEGRVRGRRYERNQNLELLQVSIKLPK